MRLRQLSEKKRALAVRSKVFESVRKFFAERGFIEVETPVRIPVPALELHIDAEASGTHYLRTSPELHMKQMLAAGYDKIYQIGPCFRRGERGKLHNPEYTMLEWYRANANYLDVLVDAKALIAFVAKEICRGTNLSYRGNAIELMPIWDCHKVEELFLSCAGWNPVTAFDADRFDMDLVEKIEPCLSLDHPVILMNYPAQVGALARLKADRPEVAERWELYIAGIELANAFSELTDHAEQRLRFEECAKKRSSMGKDAYALDEQFLDALVQGMPPAGGVALGMDRLVMLLSDSASIDDVRAFCE